MCGIAGCLKYSGKINHNRFEKMVDIVEHRGPDDRGSFYEDNLALGHRRLSVIDLSKDGHQPFSYKNRYVIVFNGEIYNYLELKDRLIEKGCEFETKTDTEVLVAAYSVWGEDCVRYFNGMWSFALYDRKQKVIFCSRDRFGVKPFYYTEQEETFLFASEIKQFFEILEKRPCANRPVLLQYLITGSIDYSAETMFQDIYQLPGGHNLRYDIEKKIYSINQYYDIRKTAEVRNEYKKACKQFRKKFFDAVDLRLRSDVPIGYCLSGGLDSSAIVCVASKINKDKKNIQKQITISSCFDDARYDEQEYIDEVAKHTSIDSKKVFPQEMQLFEEMDDIIWHMDEPFGSTSIYAQWKVFQMAKNHQLKVMLDGQGADEQLAGYTGFYTVLFAECLRSGQWKRFLKEWKIYRKQRAVTEQHISPKEILLSAVGSVLVPDKYKYLLKEVYFSLAKNSSPFLKGQFHEALKNQPVYFKGNAREYIAESMRNGMAALLHYEDRDSMAHSIEARIPFLDYELVEAIYAMPFDYKLRRGITKAVLRDGLDGILPKKIKNRYSKMGFVTPEEQWINHNFDKYRAELQNAVNILSELLEPDSVMKWFDSNKGKIKREDCIPWRIICAGHWVQVFHVLL